MKKSNPRIKTDWLRGKVGKEAEDLEYVIRNNPILIEAFLEILKRYEKEEDRGEITLDQYDSPSWGYKQADRNGARRAYAKVRSLFQTQESETND